MKKIMLMLVAVIGLTVIPVSAKAEVSVAEKVAFYIPNLVVDAVDIFSISLGVGPVARIELMATEACRGGVRFGFAAQMVKQVNRQYGFGVRSGQQLSVIALGYEEESMFHSYGTVNAYDISLNGVPDVNDVLYDVNDGARDYWRLGGALGLLVEGELYLHPLEIADFVCGVFMYDLKGDDLSSESFRMQ